MIDHPDLAHLAQRMMSDVVVLYGERRLDPRQSTVQVRVITQVLNESYG